MEACKKRVLFLLVIFLALTPLALAADTYTYLVSNSESWKDVYSTILYANLKGLESDFLVSTNHGPLLLNNINKNNVIRVIASKTNPYIFNYPDMIKSRGFKGADEIISDNANLELVKDLDVNNFIIVGDSYGFPAMAVTPYAIQTKSWVFLANKRNILEIDSFLSGKNINKILIYGFVDREVRDTLSKYRPEIIDNQDKFKDNVEIVKKYIENNPVKQVVLSNGEFIEKEIMRGVEPVLFTGRENVQHPS